MSQLDMFTNVLTGEEVKAALPINEQSRGRSVAYLQRLGKDG